MGHEVDTARNSKLFVKSHDFITLFQPMLLAVHIQNPCIFGTYEHDHEPSIYACVCIRFVFVGCISRGTHSCRIPSHV